MPLPDASAVILRRVLVRQSPVKAGRDHMHHILLDRGFTVNRTVFLMVSLQVAMALFAISLKQSGFIYSDMVLFWGFVGLVLARARFIKTPLSEPGLVIDSVGTELTASKAVP